MKSLLKFTGFMRKLLCFFVLLAFSFQLSAFADINCNNGQKLPSQSKKTWYELYQERVTCFCDEYKQNDASSETVYLLSESDGYPNLSGSGVFQTIGASISWDIEKSKAQYRKNMDNIYNCATYLSTYRAIKLVKDKLAKESAQLNARLSPKLDNQLQQIKSKMQWQENKCKVEWKSDNIIKKSVLKQTTYELCRYRFYLEYLKEHNNNLANLVENFDEKDFDTTSPKNQIWVSGALKDYIKKMNAIDKEANEVIEVYPIAFKAFSEYENNLVVHIMLELLREDFIVLREKLHQNLNPINQVVYKIANAMKK